MSMGRGTTEMGQEEPCEVPPWDPSLSQQGQPLLDQHFPDCLQRAASAGVPAASPGDPSQRLTSLTLPSFS